MNRLLLFLYIGVIGAYSAVGQDSTQTTKPDDIEVRMPMDSAAFEAILKRGDPTPTSKERNNVRVKFAVKVIDYVSKKPIEAHVEMVATSKDGHSISGIGICDAKGVFRLQLSPETDVSLRISYGDYMPISRIFKLMDDDGNIPEKISKLYKLKKLSVGEYIKLKGINFEQGKVTLKSSSFKQLDNLVALLNENPSMNIELAGHTDNTGSEKAMKKLSEERVGSVKAYLATKGIKGNRIKGVGYGGSRPIASGDDAKALRKNRRVEFKLIKN